MHGIEAALLGRLGGVPEFRKVKAGTLSVIAFSVACDAKPPQWVRVACFGGMADELAELSLQPGERLYCEGRLKLDTWEKDGQRKAGLSLVASIVLPLARIGKRKPSATGKPGTPPSSCSAESDAEPFNDRIPL